jgi:hypothetical protein
MADSDVQITGSKTALALCELARLLDRVLDEGAPAFALRYQIPDGWQVLVGDPEGDPSKMTRFGVLPVDLAQGIFEKTTDGLNTVVVNGDIYRFARAEFRIGEGRATIFVPG